MKNYKHFNEQAIYSADYNEEYAEIDCNILKLNVGDEFEIITGQPNYIGEMPSTKTAFYRGKKFDLRYFSYTPDGLVYKIPLEELEEKIV